MLTKNMIALAAASVMVLGTASMASANDKEDYPGGFRVGPLGQRLGPVRGPAFGFAHGRYRPYYRDFAFEPGRRQMWRHEYREY
jgi:hypothetical protein